MRSRWLILLATLTLFCSSILVVSPAVQQSAHAATVGPKVGSRTTLNGYLIGAPVTTTVPVNLSMQTIHNGIITVTVTSATRIVRRYNGPSGLDELSANDVLQVEGRVSSLRTVTASLVRDMSIQIAFTRALGKVTAVTPNSVSVIVQRDVVKSPLSLGQNITLPVGPSTTIISGTTTMTGTTSPITVGMRIISLGVYNRISNTFKSTWRIRLLTRSVTPPPATSTPAPATGTAVVTGTSVSATSTPLPATATPVATSTPISATATSTTTVPGARAIGGPIVSAPADDNAPTTFTVQDPHFGLVTVNVPAGIHVYRRFGALTQLDELNIGDNMHINGSFTTANTFAATSIQDLSIQGLGARAIAKIVGVNGSTVTATVMSDPYALQAIAPTGTLVTITVSANTKYLIPNPSTAHGVIAGSLSDLAANQVITVSGVFDRKSHTFIVASHIRVHRS